MNKRVKGLLAVTCCIVLVVASILGTVAYMTDRTAVTNTFTVGEVDIKLDEAKVNNDGQPVDAQGNVVTDLGDAERVEGSSDPANPSGNSYKLIPGMTYTKDPTVTVLKGSEESYVRVMVTLSYYNELAAILGTKLPQDFADVDFANWTYETQTADTGKNTVTYEFRYNGTVNALEEEKELPPLFTEIKIPGEITGEQLATLVTTDASGEITGQFTITVEGHAIQAATFADADAAWAAFDTQMNS